MGMGEVRCRNGDDGEGGESDDATVAGGSAPPSPCLWQNAKQQTVACAGNGDDRENAEEGNQASKPRVVPLNTFFGAPTFPLPMLMPKSECEDAKMPVMAQQSSSSAVVKDTLLLVDLEAKMERRQQQQSQSPVSSIWSSPVAPQASAVASPSSPPPQPAVAPVQASRVPASRSFGNSKPLSKPRALILSPMSQLNVLSQISEMADRQAQLAETPTPVVISTARTANVSSSSDERCEAPSQQSRQHAWASALKTGEKRQRSGSITSSPVQAAGTAKKKAPTRSKKTASKQQHRLSVAIIKDMVDWESCSEDIFLENSNDDSENDMWIFEDVSDSDFE